MALKLKTRENGEGGVQALGMAPTGWSQCDWSPGSTKRSDVNNNGRGLQEPNYVESPKS